MHSTTYFNNSEVAKTMYVVKTFSNFCSCPGQNAHERLSIKVYSKFGLSALAREQALTIWFAKSSFGIHLIKGYMLKTRIDTFDYEFLLYSMYTMSFIGIHMKNLMIHVYSMFNIAERDCDLVLLNFLN